MRDPVGARLGVLATILAFAVAALGSYVRVSDAGLSCPDWPFCYGQLTTPDTPHEIDVANEAYPHRPVETHKGRKEMLHRYLASTLGLVILVLAVRAFVRRERVALPSLLLAVVILQGLLGMWTVTLLVHPAVVTAHLIGGLTTFALSLTFALERLGWLEGPRAPVELRVAATFALVVVGVQICLGGWTSTHYAALACTAFPGCHPGNAWPAMDFSSAFVVMREVGVSYESGVLGAEARMAVHMVHRLGALLVTVAVLVAVVVAIRSGGLLKKVAWYVLGALGLQLSLGISAVLLLLPKSLAVAHNAGAALLVGSVTTLVLVSFRDRGTRSDTTGRA
ncbi:MAG: COX15/CtaA family protein [Deltaproteobacteria bacterium]|nr:COX15/CtaA family protein [Deltaproteobacteria bacterium]